MSFNRSRWLLIIPALALLAACQQQAARPSVESVAILRFENLGNNIQDDWIGRALSEVIASELQGVPGINSLSATKLHAVDAGFGRRPVTAPGVSAERTSALAEGATRIGYGKYYVRDGLLHASLIVEDVQSGKMTQLKPVTAPVADVVSGATALASQISDRATPYGTKNAQVVRAHVEALEGGATAATAADLQNAITADPNFGPSYQQLAQFKAQQNDVPGAVALLDAALARGNALDSSERARIQLQKATLRNDPAARIEALTELAKVAPDDPQVWRDMATLALALRRYPQAVQAYRRTVAMQPNDADIWNQYGYAAAYAGDLSTANDALQKYQKLVPSSPNPLDSMGDVNLIAGHLAEAENYYKQAAKMNAAFFAGLDFVKAALSHLLTGDVSGADATMQQYFEARTAAKDPMVDYRKAQWLWFSGRRKAACLQMEKLAADSAAPREVVSHATADLAMWNLMLGNRDAAAQFAQKAMTATPTSATEAVLARFLLQPPAPAAEWEKRANQLAPNPVQAQVRDLALAYGLLFAKDYSAAVPVLQRMYDSGNTLAGEGLPVLLAWTRIETGNVDQAAALLRSNLPLTDTGLSWSTALYLPRMFYLRGLAADKQGKQAEAKENYRIFRLLSGPDPLIWGEESKVQ